MSPPGYAAEVAAIVVVDIDGIRTAIAHAPIAVETAIPVESAMAP